MSNRKCLSAQIALFCTVCFILAILCAGFPSHAKAQTGASADAQMYENIDNYLKKCAKTANIPALSVRIVNKNEVLFSANYRQCKSSDTPFLLGSVSKSFTAVCIMQLVEQHKVDLSAPISVYLPDITDGDRITPGQLLNHTSGLGEHQTLQNCKIVNKQGEHHYANVNFTLLGKIIEAVSGKSYSEYISENLFEPLGLSHTAATQSESEENGLIEGYTNYWGVPVKSAHHDPSTENAWITVPAGYISSSASDLGKYLQMYLNGGNGILSQSSIDTMFYGDTVYVEDDVPFWYGYGWAMVKEPLSEPVLRHSGLIETGTSCIFILPERDIAVAIEGNLNDYFVANEMMDSLGWGVILMLLGDSPNEIADNAYLFHHLWIDFMMLMILSAAILPWCLLPRYVRTIRVSVKSKIVRLILIHLCLPIFILLFIPIFFATPLWVAKAFVPDIFITVMLSSALLLIGGLVKAALLYKNRR